MVSFGKNPNDGTEIGLGVGVYSNIYCIADAGENPSNCGMTNAVGAAIASTATKT